MAVDRCGNPRGRGVTTSRPIVALDTNALMMPVECNVRPFEGLERLLGATDPVVPRTVLAELESFVDDGSEAGAAARVGRELADRHCRPVGDEDGSADANLLSMAANGAVDYVMTNDAPLRRRILDVGVPVISLRGRTNLAIIRP